MPSVVLETHASLGLHLLPSTLLQYQCTSLLCNGDTGMYSHAASIHHQSANISSGCVHPCPAATAQLSWWQARALPTSLTQQIHHSRAAAAAGTTLRTPDPCKTVCHRHLRQQQLAAAVAAVGSQSVEDPPGPHTTGQKFEQPKGVGQLR
jgi:hypothetical protein